MRKIGNRYYFMRSKKCPICGKVKKMPGKEIYGTERCRAIAKKQQAMASQRRKKAIQKSTKKSEEIEKDIVKSTKKSEGIENDNPFNLRI